MGLFLYPLREVLVGQGGCHHGGRNRIGRRPVEEQFDQPEGPMNQEP
jgi:hypothetical protein